MEHKHVLAKSKHYQVSHEFETVFLLRKTALFATQEPEITIGDFYGDPTVALIDEKERFVIMAGCGLIIYYLAEPFESYRYDTQSCQWAEMFREEPNRWWIKSLTQQEENIFYFGVDPNSEEAGTYKLTSPDLAIQKL